MKRTKGFTLIELLVVISIIAILAGIAVQNGSGSKEDQEKLRDGKIVSSHFAEVPMYSSSGMALTNADFDGDGDIDLLVGAYYSSPSSGRIYFYENDGNGNFRLKNSDMFDYWEENLK